MLSIFITYSATMYTKGSWFDNPFVVAILWTKFFTTCVKSAKITHNSEQEHLFVNVKESYKRFSKS